MLSFPLGQLLEMALAGGRVNLCLTFQEIAALFSKVATSFYIPPQKHLFLRISEWLDTF